MASNKDNDRCFQLVSGCYLGMLSESRLTRNHQKASRALFNHQDIFFQEHPNGSFMISMFAFKTDLYHESFAGFFFINI